MVLRRTALAAFLSASIGLLGSSVYAEDQQSQDSINLVGEWKNVSLNVAQAGDKSWTESTVDWRFVVSDQSNGIFKGKVVYQSSTHAGHDGKAETTGREIDMLGTVSATGDEVTFVTVGEEDGSVYRGRIIDQNTIDWVMYETGKHGWIGHSRAVRQ